MSNCCPDPPNTIAPPLVLTPQSNVKTETTSFDAYMVSGGAKVVVEVIRNEDGSFLRYVGHRGNGVTIDPLLASDFTLVAPSGSILDAEVVCLSNNGGTTVVKGVAVYNLSQSPPTETHYINGALVTGYVQVSCQKADTEITETCYTAINTGSGYTAGEKVVAYNVYERDVLITSFYLNVNQNQAVSPPISDLVPCGQEPSSPRFTTHIEIQAGSWYVLLPYEYKSISISPNRTTTREHYYQNISNTSGLILLDRDVSLDGNGEYIPDLYRIFAGDNTIHLILQ